MQEAAEGNAKPATKKAAGGKNAAAEPRGGRAGKPKQEGGKEPAVKREKKVFDLPGQTRETPDEASLAGWADCFGVAGGR